MAHEAGAIRSQDLNRVAVDTTVQPKAITFPNDAKLLREAIKGLNCVERKHGVKLRQSFLRIAKTAAMMARRYAHAKQIKRHQRQLRILRTGWAESSAISAARIEGQAVIENVRPPAQASQIRSQQQRQRLEALFLLRPGGGVHRQGQSSRALLVRFQSLYRHQQPPCSR